MKQFVAIAALVLGTTLIGGAGTVLADGGKGVAVKPLAPQAGQTVTVKGDLLGAGQVEVRVIGRGIDLDLGEVATDAGGDFTADFRLPADLPPGTYTVRARGAETAETQITVVAAGASQAAPMGGMAEAAARQRPLAQTAGLVLLFGLIAALGLFFARTAHERPTGPGTTA